MYKYTKESIKKLILVNYVVEVYHGISLFETAIICRKIRGKQQN